MILASSVHHHKTEEVPAHDAAILQEKAGAKIGPVSQEDDVLRTVGVQDIGHVEDVIHLAGLNAGQERGQGDLAALPPGHRFELGR